MIQKFWSTRRRRKADGGTSGSAAVEFAVVLPVLMALVAGSINYGLMGLQMSTLISAARGGAEYAKSNPTDRFLAANTGDVTTITGATGSSTTAGLTCRCADNSSASQTNCTIGKGDANPCGGNGSNVRPIYSVQVGTTQSALFSLGHFSFSSLSATATMRED